MNYRLRSISAIVLIALVGCSSNQSHKMGTVDLASNEVTVKSMPTSPGTVKLSGVMIDKCPVSGCWFHLKDKTGIIKVDLKATNFTSTPIPT